jgi:predicted nucleic acid-binding protein
VQAVGFEPTNACAIGSKPCSPALSQTRIRSENYSTKWHTRHHLDAGKNSKAQQQTHFTYKAGIRLVERVYLDTNVYCRPLDNQSDSRIHAESEAFLKIVDAAENGKIEIVSSDYVKFEIEHITDVLKRKDIRGFERTLTNVNVASSKQLTALAKTFACKCSIGSLDALHLAAACIGKADFLLTCDDEILDNAVCIETLAEEKGYKLKVRNPIGYLKDSWRVKK